MAFLYSVAILLGSFLLFLVQPMCAKMLLPLLGGTPAVWTTCMLFFQAGLLCGYAYAHLLPPRIGVTGHALLHLVLLIVAYFLLPIHLPDDVPEGWHPILWLLASLTVSVGLPFVLLAAGAPLVQRWFLCRYPTRDPYFLYAASNLGSFVALAFFPLVMEPFFPLSQQSEIWKYGFLLLTALLAFCMPLRATGTTALAEGPAPTRWQRGRWIVLALIPSSLLLSVTTHLTTDVAAVPLLWVMPLGLYLWTFVLVFARRQWIPHAFLTRWLPLVVFVLLIVMLSEATQPLPLVMGMHLLAFFWFAMVCHGDLARSRPAGRYLTEFYLCLGLGGVLGGLLNALIAPLIFSGLHEYPLMIVLVCLFGLERATQPTRLDWQWAIGIGGLTAGLVLLFQSVIGVGAGPTSVAAMFAVPLLLCYALQNRPACFTLSIAAVLLASCLYHGVYGASAYRERSYYGIHRVTRLNGMHRLVHGNTVHGQQNLQHPDWKLSYYSDNSPIGAIFHRLDGDPRLHNIGVVGLGAGTLAAYSQPGQNWTFFEIDPTVVRIAQDPKLFTFLKNAQGSIHIELGDARLQLQKSEQKFGLLIVDAFGSDAIPVHLLTREALAVYLDHLEPNGVLAVHISNSYVNLEPVLANLAADAQPPCSAYVRRHDPSEKDQDKGVMPSHWMLLTRGQEDLHMPQWTRAQDRPNLGVWTDDFSNLWQVFRWWGND